MTELRTERLVLTDVAEGDAEFVLELLNDPGWIENIGDRGVRTVEEARAYIVERFSKSLWLVVREAATAEPVGMCGLVKGREGLNYPDIGYAYLARHAGRGFATEAAAVVLRHAHDVLGIERIAAVTGPDNVASQRVLEKIGLRFMHMIDLPGYDAPSCYFLTD